MNAGPHRSSLLRFFTPSWKKQLLNDSNLLSNVLQFASLLGNISPQENVKHERVSVLARPFHLVFSAVAMDWVVVYLGVRFGTGRGEALRLFDCFIMVIYTAIYLCILCYVCHYMYTIECLFVCVHVLVCVRKTE